MTDRPAPDRIVEALLARHGRTFADEIGIDIASGSRTALFRWLVAALLFSAPIRGAQAAEAARALIEAGLGTPEAMAGAAWEDRVAVLNAHGYARYDEKTATMLGEAAALLLREYNGDLNRLREAAGGDPAAIRRRLEAVKGIGPAGSAIFCREAQAAWPELRPFADDRALETARALGLAEDARGLARLVPEDDFPRLAAALVRTALAGDGDQILGQAAQKEDG
jgi:endonuclease III